MYKPPIRGKAIRKTPEKVEAPNLLGNVTSVVKLVSDLKAIKEDVISKVEDKISEASDILSQVKEAVAELKDVQKGDPGKDADEEAIINKVLLKIRQPKDGASVDEDALIRKLRDYIPDSVDEEALVQKIVKKIPKSKSEIKIIEKQVEFDPMAVIDKIMSLPEEALKRLKLKGSNIDGYDQTIAAFRNQLSRGYLHGGGGGGTGNITSVSNSDGTLTISPTTGAVVASLNLAHANTWTGAQTFTAGKLLDKGEIVFDVKAYGATGNGVTDDTTAIQSAITAAVALGGAVFFPGGTYIISSTLTITDKVMVYGTGWNSIVKIANSANIYAFTFNPTGGVRIDGAVFYNFKIDCNATNQSGTSGGIDAFSSSYGLFDHLWIKSPYTYGLSLHDDNLGGFGHHNNVRACWFHLGTDSPAGIGIGLRMHQSDENIIEGNKFESNGGNQNNAAQLFEDAGLQIIKDNVFIANPSVASVEGMKISQGNTVSGNIFDGGTNAQMELTGDYNVIGGNRFYQPISTSACILCNGQHNEITWNSFASSPTNGASKSAIDASGASGTNTFSYNTIKTDGSWASGVISGASNLILVNNDGYTSNSLSVAAGGNVTIPILASGGTPPTTTGTTKMVITDQNGLLSFATIPTGTVTSVSGTSNRITSTGGATPVIDIAATYVGQSSITTLGTITTGVWTGTTIAIANGGTGQTSAANAINALVPSQTGNAGKFLTTDGSVVSWGTQSSSIAIGSAVTSGTTQSVLFIDAGGATLAQDNANFKFNNVNHTLTVTNATVTNLLSVTGSYQQIVNDMLIASSVLKIYDVDQSNTMAIALGSNLTADRTFTLTTGNASRTLTLNGNSTLDDWFDQSVKTTASPTFANVTLSTGGAVRTTTSDTDTVLLQAYDVDGTSYTTFGTLTAGNTPTFLMSTNVGIGAAAGALQPASGILAAAGGAGGLQSSAAGAQVLGSTTSNYLISTSVTTVTVATNISQWGIIVRQNLLTEAATGTHPVIGSVAIRAPQITNGAGATTNAVTLYVDGAPTGTAAPTNVYAFWVDDGEVRIDGAIGDTTNRVSKVWAIDMQVTNAIAGSITGNAATATALATGRTISISGDLTYTSPSFDGTGNVTAAGTLATVNSNVGSFTNATITVNGKGLITAASSGNPTVAWSEVTGTSQSMAINSAYILNNASLVTATLPSTAAVGSVIYVVGKGAGGWKIAQNASGIIHFGNVNTTTGTGGSLASTNLYDCVQLVCTVANNEWTVMNAQGNITIV